MRKLSSDTKNSIVNLLTTGLSARQVATQLNIDRRTVDRLRKKHIPAIKKNSGGRPSILSAQDKRSLVRWVTSGRADTAVQLQKEVLNNFGVVVSTQTVRNALKGEGLKAIVKEKKPFLSPRHIRQRLLFARKYQDWTEGDWSRVIFSDETKINRLGSDGRFWVWKAPHSSIQQQHVNGTVKFGGGSLMVWGCITIHGVGWMCRIDGGMDAELYTNILDDYVFTTANHYGMSEDGFIFQQDNDPKHTSRKAQQWLTSNKVEVLDWPSQSPDLNPIEHLWSHLKRQLGSYQNEPTSIHELWQRVEVEWEKIPKEVCANLIKSMPKRIAEVLKAKGGYTKY